MFIPFELNKGHDVHPMFDVDPDLQFFNDMYNNGSYNSSNYYIEDTFNSRCQDLMLSSNCFSMIHLNVRSVTRNLSHFLLYLKLLNLKFSIIGLTETWFNETNVDVFSIPGYKSENNYRRKRKGGGTSIYIKKGINYKPRDDLNMLNENIESVFIEVPKSESQTEKNLIFGVIYRPPDTSVETFNELLSPILEKIRNENKFSYLMGDYNINLLNVDKHIPSAEFTETMFSNYFLPLINKPTRK